MRKNQSGQTLNSRRMHAAVLADKWSIMIVAAGLVVAASVVTILFLSPPAPAETRPSSGVPVLPETVAVRQPARV